MTEAKKLFDKMRAEGSVADKEIYDNFIDLNYSEGNMESVLELCDEAIEKRLGQPDSRDWVRGESVPTAERKMRAGQPLVNCHPGREREMRCPKGTHIPLAVENHPESSRPLPLPLPLHKETQQHRNQQCKCQRHQSRMRCQLRQEGSDDAFADLPLLYGQLCAQ
ncbi:pentatricopeptide repeat-containing protein mitochondrial-like protein [Cinnamomum micranthum f. kanehirae]|uniref:Pentatricopeptide repeat-containing protein mitochondrial-like protein n=1 Tax=Cinnamomum micranthum f. kanehirae TaxID=337451 RepID=A0A443PLW0_9MAGN|nr:pentatricopeptide repeat-containing protein mitochondrial-like protein [Cinnamomum micranthum f. kanehirae]